MTLERASKQSNAEIHDGKEDDGGDDFAGPEVTDDWHEASINQSLYQILATKS